MIQLSVQPTNQNVRQIKSPSVTLQVWTGARHCWKTHSYAIFTSPLSTNTCLSSIKEQVKVGLPAATPAPMWMTWARSPCGPTAFALRQQPNQFIKFWLSTLSPYCLSFMAVRLGVGLPPMRVNIWETLVRRCCFESFREKKRTVKVAHHVFVLSARKCKNCMNWHWGVDTKRK